MEASGSRGISDATASSSVPFLTSTLKTVFAFPPTPKNFLRPAFLGALSTGKQLCELATASAWEREVVCGTSLHALPAAWAELSA